MSWCTWGGCDVSNIRCVITITINSAAGSTSHEVPKPPSQPKVPLSSTAWPNPPRAPGEEVGAQAAMGLLGGGELVAAHRTRVLARQHGSATVEQHPREREHVL